MTTDLTGVTPLPYKITPVFDQDTLPPGLRSDHRTKAGTWALLRVLEGHVMLIFTDPLRKLNVTPDRPAQIPPEDTHFVETIGPMRMQVEFYREPPLEDCHDTG